MKPIDSTTCPRCARPYDAEHNSQCSLSKQFGTCTLFDICRGNLYWYSRIEKCHFYPHTNGDGTYSPHTVLPYLPYTITESELKLYLTFS